MALKYQRILLKISGEALAGDKHFGLDFGVIGQVTDVSKVSETDRSGLADSGENMLTLYTCVRNQRDQRWRVTAAEV